MEKALAIQKQVIEILGTEDVYLVGGSVRDIVMGNEPKDYDFTTPMLPDDIEAAVKKAGRKSYGIGKKFGTIGFKVPVNISDETGEVVATDYEYVEVTTFRSEVYTSKSRKPEVEFVASLDEDLARRDFTMNAMVLRPDGTIYDPYGGKLHIHSKQIVTVGLPKDRIQEDPLRILRAARFAARYNFEIDPNFIGKARQLADRIYDVSVERWVQELDKLLISESVEKGMTSLQKMGVLIRILPEVESVLKIYPSLKDILLFEGDRRNGNPDFAWKHLLSWNGLPHVNESDSSRIKISKYVNIGVCARLKFSNERTDIILDNKKKKQV